MATLLAATLLASTLLASTLLASTLLASAMAALLASLPLRLGTLRVWRLLPHDARRTPRCRRLLLRDADAPRRLCPTILHSRRRGCCRGRRRGASTEPRKLDGWRERGGKERG